MSLTHIKVRGAREHNLKGVDIDLPRDKLIVITGLSGSGKSSLAFDTIYAEGQRRYVESLSAYARQFLEMMQKPDVEHIEGLSPAISIEQKTTSRNPRSTVATVTEIYDYMRLLWARVGVPYSPATGLPITAQTVSQMVDRVMALPEGTRAFLLAPVVQGRKGEYRKELAEWQRSGYTRVRIDGEMYAIEDAPALDKKYKHDIEVVVDRIVVKDGIQQRLAESFEAALKLADGLAFVDLADTTVAELQNRSPELVEGRPTADSRPSTGSGLSVDGGDIPHEVVKLSNMRKTIARRLTESKQQVPHIYLTVDVRLDALLKLRGELNASLEPRGIKLSVNDMLIKALGLALIQVPKCNVSFAGDTMLQYSRADISVAVSVPTGLITPIVTDAANKSLSKISTEIAELAARAKEGKLQPHEYQGGTASISNMGMMGIKQFEAVINPPQAMIMAIGAGEKRPYIVDDALAIATVMSATGSFDHRAIDGADGAQLMKVFKELVEKPLGLVA